MKTLNAYNLPAGLNQPPVSAPGSNRIVHFGLGQFAKAHLLDYTQQVSGENDPWRVTGVSLNSAGVRNQLAAQDWLYTLTVQSQQDSFLKLMHIVDEVLFAGEDEEKLREVLTSPETQIISLTVTEKGYCLAANGGLDRENPAVQNDISLPNKPRTAIGWILWAIRQRLALGRKPVTVMALDNLNQNGEILKSQVLELAKLSEPELLPYIESDVCFPCSMVDRIVPAVSPQQKDAVAASIGVRDEACVLTESFSQWALEDNFSSQRPAWEKAGVLLCHEVALFEQMKLRLLNGAHSAIAYTGALLGCETVADYMADQDLKVFISGLLHQEIKPEVIAPEGLGLNDYIDALLVRFANPGLHHRCRQIAMDGSQKIPQRWLPVLQQRLQKQEDIAGLALAVAAWSEFVVSSNSLDDPNAEELKSIILAHQNDPIGALIIKSDIFSPIAEQLLPLVREAKTKIDQVGLRAALVSTYT